MANTLQILGQSQPADANAAALFTVPGSKTYIVTELVICNITAGALTYRVFADQIGSSFDDNNALFYDVPIAANSTVQLPVKWFFETTDSLGIRASAADSITFTAFGVDQDVV